MLKKITSISIPPTIEWQLTCSATSEFLVQDVQAVNSSLTIRFLGQMWRLCMHVSSCHHGPATHFLLQHFTTFSMGLKFSAFKLQDSFRNFLLHICIDDIQVHPGSPETMQTCTLIQYRTHTYGQWRQHLFSLQMKLCHDYSFLHDPNHAT